MAILVSDMLTSPDNLGIGSMKAVPSQESLRALLIRSGLVIADDKVVTVKVLRDFLNSMTDETAKDGIMRTELDERVPIPSPPTIDPAAIKHIATPDRKEQFSRQLIGGMYSMVLAFTIIAFTSTVVIVSIDTKTFPSTMLAAVIIIPTMMVAWYYMGIINKERRDLLSAVVGDKVNPTMVGEIIDVVRNRGPRP